MASGPLANVDMEGYPPSRAVQSAGPELGPELLGGIGRGLGGSSAPSLASNTESDIMVTLWSKGYTACGCGSRVKISSNPSVMVPWRDAPGMR